MALVHIAANAQLAITSLLAKLLIESSARVELQQTGLERLPSRTAELYVRLVITPMMDSSLVPNVL